MSFVKLTLIAILGASSFAYADTLDVFDVTGPGLSLSFTLPASPEVTNKDAYPGLTYFSVPPFSILDNGRSLLVTDAYFFNSDDLGGFEFLDSSATLIDDLDLSGAQLFSGTLNNPTFAPGSYDLSRYQHGGVYTLTISPITAAPEPGSLALLGTGALMALRVVRRKFAL